LVAEIEADGTRIGCGVSRDASASALLLLARADLSPGTKVVLRLWVPGEDEPRKLGAAVVRRERIPPADSHLWAYKIAVVLDSPPPDLDRILEELIKRQSRTSERPSQDPPRQS
jgi:hypothetical protein